MISIVLVNYNQKDYLAASLHNLKKLQSLSGLEIILVDNHSSDGSLDKINETFKDFSNLSIIASNKNLGFAGGVNFGIKSAKGDYILILNPDVIVTDEALTILSAFMEDNPECGICGPQLLNPDHSIQYSCLRWPKWYTPLYRRVLGKMGFGKKHLYSYLMKDFDHKFSQRADWLLGAALFVRKSAIDKIGLMDERFFLYFEDTDWCRRFWQNGFEVWYVAEAKMFHYHQRLSAEYHGLFSAVFSKPAWIHILSWIRYFKKWPLTWKR